MKIAVCDDDQAAREHIVSYNADAIKVVNGDKLILAQKKYNDRCFKAGYFRRIRNVNKYNRKTKVVST